MRTHAESASRSCAASPACRTQPRPSATTTSATTAPAIPTACLGEEIPVEARIVACADTYCAITVDRVRRPHAGRGDRRAASLRGPAARPASRRRSDLGARRRAAAAALVGAALRPPGRPRSSAAAPSAGCRRGAGSRPRPARRCGRAPRTCVSCRRRPSPRPCTCCRGASRRDAADRERLVAGQAERLRRLAVEELERQHAHADQVRAVDALVRLARSRRARRAAACPSRPSRATSRSRTPCRRARPAARPRRGSASAAS